MVNNPSRLEYVGRLAQLGEHRPYKPRVTGSSPVPPTTDVKIVGAVVQLVRMPACHAGGRGFESRPLRQQTQALSEIIVKCFFLSPTYIYNKKTRSRYTPELS